MDGWASAARYANSGRRLQPEELGSLLVHEEPRKVDRIRPNYGRHDQVPEAYLGQRVCTTPSGTGWPSRVQHQTLAAYPLDDEPRT